jgi:predicted phosphodiesterase
MKTTKYKESVAKLAKEIGYDSAAKKLGLSKETVRRYVRATKPAAAQLTKSESEQFRQFLERFTPEERGAILSSSGKRLGTSEPYSFEGEDFCFLVLGDTHCGSKYFHEDRLMAAMDEGRSRGCQAMLHTGDIMEGMSGRPGHVFELTHIGYTQQKEYTAQLFREWGLPLYFLTGNHTEWFNTKFGIGVDVGEDLARAIPGATFLGAHEGVIDVAGAKFMLWHGEDGSSYATSYRLQKIVEAFTGGEKPGVLMAGHSHKQAYIFDRNVHALSTGCIESQSGFMRYKRLAAHAGFWVVEGSVRDGSVVKFCPTWYPFFT